MKILVVDDELVSRKKLEKILDSLGECRSAEGGREALDAIKAAWEEKAPFDAITLDISMPGMDGTEVLMEIRDMEKERKIPKAQRARIMMVTSHSDRDNVITSLQVGCDDFITKPFDREKVMGKIEKYVLGMHRPGDGGKETQSTPGGTDIVQELTARFQRGEIDLPSLPEISLKVRRLMNENASIQEVANLVKQDAGISSKLIGLSNTTCYRGIEVSTTVEQAINRLGLELTRQWVDAICNRSLYTGIPKKYVAFVEKLWEHSLACAYASQALYEKLGPEPGADAFTMGLLHDVGKLVLVQIVSEMEKSGRFGEEVDKATLLETIGQLHGPFGAALLKRWGFSDLFIRMAGGHDSLEKARASRDILLVHFANLLVKSEGYTEAAQEKIDLEQSESARLLKMEPGLVLQILEQIRGHMEELGEILV
jgi:HD-like signal output (HDOD) protein/FixJ family two-component response regulator